MLEMVSNEMGKACLRATMSQAATIGGNGCFGCVGFIGLEC